MRRHVAGAPDPRRVPAALVALAAGVALVVGGAVTAAAPPVARSADLAAPEAAALDRAAVVDDVPGAATPPARPAPDPRPHDPPNPLRDSAVVGPERPSQAPAPPVLLDLPGVPDAVAVVPVGVLPSGALALPPSPSRIGWWAAGDVPGGGGATVLAGHVDSASEGAGPLRTLLRVGLDDVVTVRDTEGREHRYAVSSRTSYPKAALPAELFSGAGPGRLVLITCGGAFDTTTGHYADNVVVVADPL